MKANLGRTADVTEPTVKLADSVMAPSVAVIAVLPLPTAVTNTRPLSGLLTVATAGFEEFQANKSVKFWLVPSVNAPKRVNCCLVPGAIVRVAGKISIEDKPIDVT